jgi:hypothetical protein
MADPDISDYEFDADDLLLMPIIIPKFDNWCHEIFKYKLDDAILNSTHNRVMGRQFKFFIFF